MNCIFYMPRLLNILLFILLSMPVSTAFAEGEPSKPSDYRGKGLSGRIPLTEQEQAWLDRMHTVRVRVGNAPPYHMSNPEPEGISVDYLKLIGKRFGINFNFVKTGSIKWPEAVDDLTGERKLFDLLITIMRTREREKDIAFTQDYLFSPWVIINRTGAAFVSQMKDLNGKSVAVEQGYVVKERIEKEYPQIRIVPLNTSLEALQSVAGGASDAYIANLTIASYLIQNHGLNNLKVAAPTPFGTHDQAMGVRKDWPELASIINKALTAMSDAEESEIRNRWLSIRYEFGVNMKTVWSWVGGLTAAFSLVIAITLIWNRRLKKEIVRRVKAEEKLLSITKAVESTSDAVGISDSQGHHFYQNRAFTDLFGYSTAEELEAAGGGPAVVRDPEVAKEMFDKILHGKSWSDELEMLTKSGRVFPAFERADAVKDSDGNVIGLIGIIADITNQKREEKLVQARIHLIEYSISHTFDELLIETLNMVEELTGSLIGFYHFLQEDQRTLTLQVWSTRTSKNFCKAEGGGSHYDIGKAGVWVDCIHERKPVIHNDYASLPHKKGLPPGHAEVIRELAVPIFRSGRIVAILGIGNKAAEYTQEDIDTVSRFTDIAWDISERKGVTDSLRESDERFALAFDNAPIMITFSSLEDGRYLDVNQRYLAITGFCREEVIGKTSVELGWLSSFDREQFVKLLEKDGSVNDLELKLRSKSGQTVICKYWGKIITVGSQRRLLSIGLDITEQRRVEQQFIQAQKMESVGRLAGGVAHDFNNMLSIIIGHAELSLLKADKSNPLHQHMEEILDAAERSSEITKQLLAFARQQVAKPTVLDLNDAISGMIKMLRRLIGEDISLNWNPGYELLKVKIDPSQLGQIMANLCVNARDAISGVGRLDIQTENITLDQAGWLNQAGVQPGDYVMLALSDNGSGMGKNVIEHIFEPFYTTKELGHGTGLGLATTFGIVKQNGGHINVYSEPGQGTTFRIYLPGVKDAAGGAVKEKQELVGGNETILLAEDEQAILKLGTTILSNLGYKVLSANSPEEAIRLADEYRGRIHLLVTDIIMPGMNGHDLSERLLLSNPDMKCLFMSGYTADIIAERGKIAENVCFMQKPFSRELIAGKVREALKSG